MAQTKFRITAAVLQTLKEEKKKNKIKNPALQKQSQKQSLVTRSNKPFQMTKVSASIICIYATHTC